MQGIKLAWSDIKQMWASNLMRLTVFGLMIIPLVYSFVYLWAIWNPVDYLYKYPLAVVNQDQGITQKALHINVGDNLTNKLLSQDNMDWHEVTLAQANNGIKAGDYFAAVIIPNNFTEQAYSASTSNPEPVSLTYKLNEANSYIGATYTRVIMGKVKDSLRKELSTRYLEVIFEMVLQAGGGLRTAADGAQQLADGVDQAYDGSTALSTGMQQSSDGMDKLGAGLFKLNDGANQFENGMVQLNTMVQVLSAVSDQLVDNIDPRVAQMQAATQNMGQVVNSTNAMVVQARNGVARINGVADNVAVLAQQTQKLNNTLVAPITQNMTQQQTALNNAQASLNSLADTYPELKDNPDYAAAMAGLNKSLTYSSSVVAGGQNVVTSLNNLQNNINNNAQSARSQGQQLEQNLSNLSSGLSGLDPSKVNSQLETDAKAVKKLANAVVQFSDDAKRLQDGSTQLVTGLNQFTAGFSQLRSGNEKLSSGTQQLQNGLGTIDAGQHLLANKLDEGAKMAADDGHTADRIAAIADPVNLMEENTNPVGTTGIGFAPYFIAISLWVGAILVFFAVDLRKVHVMPKTIFAYTANKYLAMASVLVVQAFLSMFVLTNGLGIPTAVPTIQLYGFALIMSLSFTSLIFMLVMLFGENIGRYVGICLMMLQLTSCSGSYPVNLMAKFFEFIAPALPMTYAVHGLRDIISIGSNVMAWPDALVLAGYMVGAFIVTFTFKHKSIMEEIEEIQATEEVQPVDEVKIHAA